MLKGLSPDIVRCLYFVGVRQGPYRHLSTTRQISNVQCWLLLVAVLVAIRVGLPDQVELRGHGLPTTIRQSKSRIRSIHTSGARLLAKWSGSAFTPSAADVLRCSRLPFVTWGVLVLRYQELQLSRITHLALKIMGGCCLELCAPTTPQAQFSSDSLSLLNSPPRSYLDSKYPLAHRVFKHGYETGGVDGIGLSQQLGCEVPRGNST